MAKVIKSFLVTLSVVTLFSATLASAQDSEIQRFGTVSALDQKIESDSRGQLNLPEQNSGNSHEVRAHNTVPFVSSDPQSHLSPPTERAKIRVNPEAPGPFIGMADAYFNGDMNVAKLYAKQFVRYLNDLMFAVKDITALIGDAMIEEGSIDEESWVGVEQYLDYQMAQARAETGSAFKPTHEDALRRIKADPNGEVEIYYFFTLNSSHCRHMAADIERLWRLSKTDPKIKMVGLTLGTTAKEWISAYKDYTGMTLPIFNGEHVAKQFKVAFVPAVVIVAPNAKTAYLKTGQIDFTRLYEVVRKTQGQPLELSPEGVKLLNAKIGQQQETKTPMKSASADIYKNFRQSLSTVSVSNTDQTPTVTRF
jgi:hypothetical protein